MWERAGLYPSEPIFVPSPNAEEEDDGVILSVVITPNKVGRSPFVLKRLNPTGTIRNNKPIVFSLFGCCSKDKSTFLLVLDAKTFEELGRAAVPVNIPYGFHGTFNAKA